MKNRKRQDSTGKDASNYFKAAFPNINPGNVYFYYEAGFLDGLNAEQPAPEPIVCCECGVELDVDMEHYEHYRGTHKPDDIVMCTECNIKPPDQQPQKEGESFMKGYKLGRRMSEELKTDQQPQRFEEWWLERISREVQ